MRDSEKKNASRLFRYILRYRGRIVAGIFLSLLVSISNLFSITAFVPIFNAIGSTDEVVIFPVSEKEKEKYGNVPRGAQVPPEEEIAAKLYRLKVWANDQAKGKTAGEMVIILIVIVLPVYVFKLLCFIGTIYLIGTAGYLAVRDIRMDLYDTFNRMGLDYFGQEQTGLIMSRVINDVELVGKSISMEFNESLNNIFYIVTHFILLAYISFKFLIVIFIVVPLMMSPVNKFAIIIRRAAKAQQEKLAKLGGHIQEIISGIRVIRAFSMESFELGRFAKINEGLFKNTFRGHYYHQVGPALTEFVATIVIVGFLSWGAYEISNGALSKGLFFAFFFTLIFIMRPLKQISVGINLFSSSLAAADRIFELIDMPDGVPSAENPTPFHGLNKTIHFRELSFQYPGSERFALQNIDLEIPKGTSVSLVGSSGAGKSTLMDMLLRFYDPTSGTIEIDGTDIRDFSLTDLRSTIGVVTQNIFLFNASIRENIAYGRSDIELDRIIEVSKMANAHDFIMQLPHRYDTHVGERGVMLSGGQKQRLAIARALLLDPPVLIFDEATSSLDNESELLVRQAIDRLLAGRTVFIIAHRLSSVYNSDLILVMDQGQIAEKGTHGELLKRGKIYKKLYEMQFNDETRKTQ